MIFKQIILFLKDRNASTLLDQLEHVPDFHLSDNLPLMRDVIIYRINRNKIANLNLDMTLDYGLKIPSSGVAFTSGHDLDIEWIVSASSSSSVSVSSVSSARSQKSFLNYNNNDQNIPPTSSNSLHRNILNENGYNLNNNNNNGGAQISTGSFRRVSATKRMPWDDLGDFGVPNPVSIPKVMRSREVAPLKAFPLNDDSPDLLHSNSNISKLT